MKISYNWLRTLMTLKQTPAEIAALLTSSGLEVESIENFETIPGGLKGVIVGEVLSCEKHPDADRLKLTKVDVGQPEPLSIVCGAPNVEAGQKVLVATVGTQLHTTSGEVLQIKKSKIRGAVSEGMICAEDELGIGNSHAGIMVLPQDTEIGTPAAEYLNLQSDSIFEIGLTPNRGDAASHFGVARELNALLNQAEHTNEKRVSIPGLHDLPEGGDLNHVSVKIADQEACSRYTSLVISGIQVGPSPDWLKQRLQSVGLRPINNIVDITNFVMLETGQPLHAFDTAKIGGHQVNVRFAKEAEKFVTLDGIERTLKSNDLVIADKDHAMCLAGVFGGIESGVSDNTTSVFLESAYFHPSVVRRTARNHGLKSDASFRFERGTDPEMTIPAITRAANLIMELAGGNISMGIRDLYPAHLEPFRVAFSYNNCFNVIGKEIDKQSVKRIITSLGIEIDIEGADGLLLLVPRYKGDVQTEIDVIEEVMRIYGYDHVEPAGKLHYHIGEIGLKNANATEEKISVALTGMGFNEIMGVSLSSSKFYPGQPVVKVLNPISSELDVMRTDMLHSGLECVAYNLNRKNNDLRLYECGRTYILKGDAVLETRCVSLLMTGKIFETNPYGFQQSAGMVHLSAAVKTILERFGLEMQTETSAIVHGLRSTVAIMSGKRKLGYMGEVNRETLKQFDIEQPVYQAVLETDLVEKSASRTAIVYKEVSKFPAVRRDLALLIDQSVRYADVERIAYNTEKKWLTNVQLFDIYEDKKLNGKKSYAVSFTLLNPDATLTDKQVDQVMQKLIDAYTRELGAQLR